jgi:hypothetical protein
MKAENSDSCDLLFARFTAHRSGSGFPLRADLRVRIRGRQVLRIIDGTIN